LFYLRQFGELEAGIQWGLTGGLYLIVALILTLGGRLIPVFTRLGAGYEVEPKPPPLLTILSLIVFLPFFVVETFGGPMIIAVVAAVLACVIHLVRSQRWYTPGIWRNPLLWSLHLAYLVLAASFAMYAVEHALTRAGANCNGE
jgi:uncharacterized protein involved in response to NO